MNISSISYILIVLTFLILAIEDFRTRCVDLRICFVLLLAVLFHVYVNETLSILDYLINLIHGFLFILFIYVLGLKALTINIYDSNKNYQNTHELGFIPSFTTAYLIYYLISDNKIIKTMISNSDYFLDSCGLYLF